MRIDAMITICIDQKVCDLDQSSYSSISSDPSSLDCNNSTHNSKTCSTNCAGIGSESCFAEIWFIPGFINIIPVMFSQNSVTSFQCQPAYRMCSMPEKTESLFLHCFE